MTILGSYCTSHIPEGAERVAGSPFTLGGVRARAWNGVHCAIDGNIDGSSTPSEPLVAQMYRDLGEAALADLRGEFVVALWDSERRAGALARDRLGERPLYYCRAGSGVVFASELRDLLQLLPSRPAPDETWLAHWLARRVAPPESTPYAGVRRLPAGHVLRLRDGRWSAAPWWQPPGSATLDIAGPAAAAALREEMRAAVDRTLAAASAPGVMLSGGFDSASIAALLGPRHARVYSGIFPSHTPADESVRIRHLRGQLGLAGVEQVFGGGGALRTTLEFIGTWGIPPASPNVFIWQELMRRAARDGTDVLLDGEGGDELFGCSTPLLADLLMRGRLNRTLRVARRIPGMGDSPRPRWLRRAVWRYGVCGALPARIHSLARRARHRGPGGPTWLTASLRSLLDDSHRDAWKLRPGPRWRAALVDATGAGADARGTSDQFRREAADAGLRLAHPWRDTELIDFVLRLPPELAFDPYLDRPLAREAMRGLVPDEVRLNDSKPYFNDPLADALSGPDRELLTELATTPELDPYVRRDRLPDLLGRRPGPAWPLDVWRVASAGAWLRCGSDATELETLLARAPGPAVTMRDVDPPPVRSA